MVESDLETNFSVDVTVGNIIRVSPNSKHQFVQLTVDLGDSLECYVTPGQLGVTKLLHINPQPLKDHFSVVWNGDRINPKLVFDGAPETADILVEVWGG